MSALPHQADVKYSSSDTSWEPLKLCLGRLHLEWDNLCPAQIHPDLLEEIVPAPGRYFLDGSRRCQHKEPQSRSP